VGAALVSLARLAADMEPDDVALALDLPAYVLCMASQAPVSLRGLFF
jgi:hypothetical protein